MTTTAAPELAGGVLLAEGWKFIAQTDPGLVATWRQILRAETVDPQREHAGRVARATTGERAGNRPPTPYVAFGDPSPDSRHR